MRLVSITIVGLVLLGRPAAAAEAEQAHPGDPEAGARLYKQLCRGCHGADGRGGGHTFMPHVDRLTRKGYIDLLPDERLVAVITEGGAAHGMSSYMPAWGDRLSPDEIRDIVAHVRTLPLH
jgi:mono/diheme cytochrome c family protein